MTDASDSIEILPLSAKHIPLIAALEKEVFSEPWTEGMLKGELQNPAAVWRVAMNGEKLAGYAGMHFIEGTGYITNIAVAANFRGKGLADRLLDTLVSYCVERDGSELTLEVRPSNTAAMNFYHSHGFVQAGLRRGYYSVPSEDAFLMTKYL